MKKRLVVWFLVLTMLCGVSSYGLASNINWMDRYDEPTVLTTVTSEYAAMVYPEGDDITNNWWTRAYEEYFNIKLVTEWVSDDYATKINLAIVSGDLPDTFKVDGNQLRQLVEAGLIMDMTETFDLYASETAKKFMASDPKTFESGMIDGKLYGISHLNWGTITQPNYIWLRDDWMKEQNLSEPKTMQELEAIMQAFMDNYGAYGIAMDKDLSELYAIAPAWGAQPNIWVRDSSGEIVSGVIQPEMKQAVAAWADWYQKGYINPDFVFYDFNAMNTDVITGKVGVQPFQQWWGYIPGPDVVRNQGNAAVFQPYLIPTATGEQVMYPIYFDNQGYTVVNKNCKNPEAVVKLINFFAYIAYDSYGEVEFDQEREENGNYAHITGAFRLLNPDSTLATHNRVAEAVATNDTSVLQDAVDWLKYTEIMDWIENKNPAGLGSYFQSGAGDHAAFKLADDIMKNQWYIQTGVWGVTPETAVEYGSTLNSLMVEGITKIIIGEADIDYFDTLVENWKAAGGDLVTEAINEMYR